MINNGDDDGYDQNIMTGWTRIMTMMTTTTMMMTMMTTTTMMMTMMNNDGGFDDGGDNY